jgi:hypothetical protein
VDEVRTIDAYVAVVRDALADVPTRVREDALAELESLLRADAERRGEAAAIEDLGYPNNYAKAIRLALTGDREGPQPQGRIFGMPYDFRGANATRLAERMWNPADPRIFMPRLFGIGWTFNFGAVAVKLGLIRPDDAGDESYERVPDGVVRAALAVPALFALGALVAVAASWASLPAEVPVHWGSSGAPDDWAPKWLALGALVAITVLPVAVTYARILRRGTPTRTRVLSASALGLLTVLGAGIIGLTIVDADGGRSGVWALGIIAGALCAAFLLLYVPMRLGMRAEWRDSLGQEKGDA